MGRRYKDGEAWLEWAQNRYEQARGRFAYASSTDSDTMDSYSELAAVLEDGLAYHEALRFRKEALAKDDSLARLAEQLEFLGESGFSLPARSCLEAAQIVRRAIGC